MPGSALSLQEGIGPNQVEVSAHITYGCPPHPQCYSNYFREVIIMWGLAHGILRFRQPLSDISISCAKGCLRFVFADVVDLFTRVPSSDDAIWYFSENPHCSLEVHV